MTEEEFEALETELDEINYSDAVWTQEALDRQAELIAILDKAGRL